VLPPRLVDALRALVRAGEDKRVGWKIGGGIRAVEELLGPGGVTIGHLTSATLLPDGGAFDPSDVSVLRVETELALEVGPDLGLGGVGVALEIVDLGATDAPLEQVVADNLLHRAFVLGPSGTNVSAVAEARIRAGDSVHSARVSVDAEQVIATVMAQLSDIGEELRPGERILSGSLAQIPARQGDLVAAEIDGLGRLEVTIA
jgi:2-keto-4-pentenoate hydratase